MAKLTETEKKIIMRVEQLTKRFSFLDDYRYMMTTKRSEYRKQLKRYKDQLEKLLLDRYFTNRIKNLIIDADKTFLQRIKDLLTRKLVKRPKSTKALFKPITDRFTLDLKRHIDDLIAKQFTKKISTDVLTETFKIQPDTPIDKRLKVVNLTKPNGQSVEILGQDVKNIERITVEQYGNVDTLKYNTGANNGTGSNYPLVSHIENITTTIDADVARSVNLTRTNELGIYTVKVSSHHGKYSCALHEGEIVFTSANSKLQFQKQNPQFAKQVSKFRTLEELRNDPTRIFKFNCSHTYRVYPLQFFGNELIEKDIKSNPIRPTPNLSESKLRKLVA
jgi:hypothetical protein